jgi:hypothetical protein
MKSLWKWRNGLWYFLSGFVFFSGIILISTLAPWHIIQGAVYILIGGPAFWFLFTGERRYRRSGVEPHRSELLILLLQRTVDKESVWLNRDRHLVFYAYKHGRVFRRIGVARADEDQARVLEATGRAAMTSEVFEITPVIADVTHHVYGAVGVMDDDGGSHLERSPAEKIRWWRLIIQYAKMARTGLLYASAEDLKELISQFRDAEPAIPEQWPDE